MDYKYVYYFLDLLMHFVFIINKDNHVWNSYFNNEKDVWKFTLYLIFLWIMKIKKKKTKKKQKM